MDDKEWRVRVVGRAVSLGKQDPRDLEEVKAHGFVTKPADSSPVPVADLVRHMDAHYSEYQLRNDLDCVLSLCGSEIERAEVKRFARAKLAGKPYVASGVVHAPAKGNCKWCGYLNERNGSDYCSDKCKSWDTETGSRQLPRILKTADGRQAKARLVKCPECPREFEAARVTAKYCSERCKKRAYRKGVPVPAISG
jgi:hypothetical protein